MPGGPGAHRIVVAADHACGVLDADVDRPPHAGDPDQLRDRGVGGAAGAMGGELGGIAQAAPGGQPVRGGGVVPARKRDPDPIEAPLTPAASTHGWSGVSTHRRSSAASPELSSAVTHAAGSWAANARSRIRQASCGVAATPVSSGAPASSSRARSLTRTAGRERARPTKARPWTLAHARKTPIRQVPIRPAVPEHCRWPPTDLAPCVRKAGFVADPDAVGRAQALGHVAAAHPAPHRRPGRPR